MAIQRLRTTRMKTDLIIAVLDDNPALGTPTPKFRKPVKQVTVDGRPWQRFDEGRVQLPIALGQITVQTRHGAGTVPRLARSTMDFSVWEWSPRDGERYLLPILPPWCDQTPAWDQPTALLRTKAGASPGTPEARCCIAGRVAVSYHLMVRIWLCDLIKRMKANAGSKKPPGPEPKT
jgi:hypothetical protein